MNQVMIDLETMGTSTNSAIMSIGAVVFDIKSGNIGNKFEVHIDLNSSIKAGFDIDADTIYWWLKQNKDAQKKTY